MPTPAIDFQMSAFGAMVPSTTRRHHDARHRKALHCIKSCHIIGTSAVFGRSFTGSWLVETALVSVIFFVSLSCSTPNQNSNPGANEQQQLEKLFSLIKSENYSAARDYLSTIDKKGTLINLLETFVLVSSGESKQAKQKLFDFIDSIRLQEGIRITKLDFCRKINQPNGFRNYEVEKEHKFKPGSPVLLYVEIDNFQLEQSNDRFILNLIYNWELFDERGKRLELPAWQNVPLPEKQDRIEFSGPIREFYQSFKLPLPRNIHGGTYTIIVTVEDQIAKKSDKASIQFDIVFE